MIIIEFKKCCKTYQKGFTLIELLVVISITSLLSTVILASLNDARRKATNTQVQQEVGQWLKAIELYKDDNGLYPMVGSSGVGGDSRVCLGGSYISCENNSAGYYESNSAHNSEFKSQLSKYINTSQNPNRKPVYFLNGSLRADKISAYHVSWGGCGDDGCDGSYFVILMWFLEGNDWQCGYGARKESNNSGNYYCTLDLYQGYMNP